MSLSLKRGPDPAAKSGRGVGAKRRDNSAGRAEDMAKSDILACSEAQSFIQQRAAALEKMDDEHLATASLLRVQKGKAPAAYAKSTFSGNTTSLRLWDMGALPDASGREYCEIFENYKVCRLGHASSDVCLSDAVDRMLVALSLEEQDQFGSGGKSGFVDEATLRNGYMRLLRAVHGSFARQVATLRCAKWVESGDVSSVDSEGSNGGSSVVILSSSESDLDAEQRTVELLRGIDKPTLRPISSTPAAAVAGIKAPDYTRLAHAELQALAEKYGLRTNTPRRLLIHQLQTIWEQTSGKKPSVDIVSTLPDPAAPERAAEDVQALFGQFRRYIRGNTGLFEQILCYRVLDFGTVYQDISAAVKCQKWVLRKFFDLEGIVYSSYHD
ncbi:hypothetical protein GGF42_005280 [Coemansia sp. RSA 2424]|nr:hypothetical protein GGF42_005280 [Coemansia sp. RSA 2424]